MKKVLICVAHSDDETIGCGATIVNHVKKGDKVYCISMTDGVSARHPINKKNLEIRNRKIAAEKASKILGFKWINKFCGNFPDNAMDTVKFIEIVRLIEKAKKTINPEVIYTHSNSDLNIDHKIVCQATITAFRPQPKEKWEKILSFEIPSSTDYGDINQKEKFNPNYFVNIKKNWKKKLLALRCYKKEIRKYPHSRSYKGIELLAKNRGVQIGFEMAEAFQIIKQKVL